MRDPIQTELNINWAIVNPSHLKEKDCGKVVKVKSHSEKKRYNHAPAERATHNTGQCEYTIKEKKQKEPSGKKIG